MSFSLICCVVNMGEASRVMKAARKHGIKNAIVSLGRGTAKSRVLKLFAIDEVRKEVLTMIIDDELCHQAMKGISDELMLEKPNHGIVFSYSISEFIDSKNNVSSDSKADRGDKGMYKIIYAIVDKGKAEEVIEAADLAGSTGGTILNARGAGSHEVQTFFSVPIEPEREEVFIIAKNELKDGIVDSIRKHLKIEEPGNGILFVLDVNEVYGLHPDF